jgi:hypothetical protein
MDPKVAGSCNLQMQQKKQEKSDTLDELVRMMQGNCVICLTWKAVVVKIAHGINHRWVSDCRNLIVEGECRNG